MPGVTVGSSEEGARRGLEGSGPLLRGDKDEIPLIPSLSIPSLFAPSCAGGGGVHRAEEREGGHQGTDNEGLDDEDNEGMFIDLRASLRDTVQPVQNAFHPSFSSASASIPSLSSASTSASTARQQSQSTPLEIPLLSSNSYEESRWFQQQPQYQQYLQQQQQQQQQQYQQQQQRFQQQPNTLSGLG